MAADPHAISILILSAALFAFLSPAAVVFLSTVVKANAIFVPGQERSIDNVVQFIRGATPADDNLKVFSNNDKPVAILLYGPTGSLRTDTVQKLLPKICETGEGTRCPDVYFNIDGHMARMTSETWGGTKSNDKNGLLQLAQKCGLTGFSGKNQRQPPSLPLSPLALYVRPETNTTGNYQTCSVTTPSSNTFTASRHCWERPGRASTPALTLPVCPRASS